VAERVRAERVVDLPDDGAGQRLRVCTACRSRRFRAGGQARQEAQPAAAWSLSSTKL
jgi:hypothetical protein